MGPEDSNHYSCDEVINTSDVTNSQSVNDLNNKMQSNVSKYMFNLKLKLFLNRYKDIFYRNECLFGCCLSCRLCFDNNY